MSYFLPCILFMGGNIASMHGEHFKNKNVEYHKETKKNFLLFNEKI